MRSVLDEAQFTPFGMWIRQYVRDGLSITNLDYVIEDYKSKKIMLLEEKQNGGSVHPAQRMTFQTLDRMLEKIAGDQGYEYWGFFVFRLPPNTTMPGPGMTLNMKPITCEQLQAHLGFAKKFCNGVEFVNGGWRERGCDS